MNLCSGETSSIRVSPRALRIHLRAARKFQMNATTKPVGMTQVDDAQIQLWNYAAVASIRLYQPAGTIRVTSKPLS